MTAETDSTSAQQDTLAGSGGNAAAAIVNQLQGGAASGPGARRPVEGLEDDGAHNQTNHNGRADAENGTENN